MNYVFIGYEAFVFLVCGDFLLEDEVLVLLFVFFISCLLLSAIPVSAGSFKQC